MPKRISGARYHSVTTCSPLDKVWIQGADAVQPPLKMLCSHNPGYACVRPRRLHKISATEPKVLASGQVDGRPKILPTS